MAEPTVQEQKKPDQATTAPAAPAKKVEVPPNKFFLDTYDTSVINAKGNRAEARKTFGEEIDKGVKAGTIPEAYGNRVKEIINTSTGGRGEVIDRLNSDETLKKLKQESASTSPAAPAKPDDVQTLKVNGLISAYAEVSKGKTPEQAKTEMGTNLDKAVTDGLITKAAADKTKEILDKSKGDPAEFSRLMMQQENFFADESRKRERERNALPGASTGSSANDPQVQSLKGLVMVAQLISALTGGKFKIDGMVEEAAKKKGYEVDFKTGDVKKIDPNAPKPTAATPAAATPATPAVPAPEKPAATTTTSDPSAAAVATADPNPAAATATADAAAAAARAERMSLLGLDEAGMKDLEKRQAEWERERDSGQGYSKTSPMKEAETRAGIWLQPSTPAVAAASAPAEPAEDVPAAVPAKTADTGAPTPQKTATESPATPEAAVTTVSADKGYMQGLDSAGLTFLAPKAAEPFRFYLDGGPNQLSDGRFKGAASGEGAKVVSGLVDQSPLMTQFQPAAQNTNRLGMGSTGSGG